MTDTTTGQPGLAARSVTCPRCHAHPGQPCTSTGGGNYTQVATHRAREARIAGWDEHVRAAAANLVRTWTATPLADRPADAFAATEAAAAPIAAKPAGQPTPRGVRLSEGQAQRIEWAAEAGGRYTVSTAHFHGDAADRQSVNALEAKGVLRQVAVSGDGYGRVMELTDFGWQVYHQHRLIIRRDPA